jgi:magnesium transporter
VRPRRECSTPPRTPALTIRSLLFDRDREERAVDLEAMVVRSLVNDRLLWVDLVDPTPEELERVAEALDLPAELRPTGQRRGRSDLQRHQGWIRLPVVAVQAPTEEPVAKQALQRVAVEVLAGENVVVTIHEGPVDAIDDTTEHLRDEPGLGVLDAAALLAALIDVVLALYLRHAEMVERRIDDLDELAIRGSAAGVYLGEVVALRRRVAGLRRSLAPHREVFGPLARPDFEIAALGRPWPGLVDRLEATLRSVENVRDLLVGSVALQQSSTAQRVNDVMKRLTLLNAILLPSVVLAGVMGMNFKLGFFDDANHFWWVLGAMAALAAGTLLLARQRGWL